MNKEGLVVGFAGPVGLRVSEMRAPVMSFLPVILMISTKEDQCAQQLLMNLWLERCHDLGLDVDFGFFEAVASMRWRVLARKADVVLQ